MEKSVEFRTSLSVQQCGLGFRNAITNGRGFSSKLGGLTAKMMGGNPLDFYPIEDTSPFAAMSGDRPAFSVGVSVPRANGAHLHGSNIAMLVWDRGTHRDVALLADHSLAGGSHALKLMAAVQSEIQR